MLNINVSTHPLIKHKLAEMRNKNTSRQDFRRLLKEITLLIAFEVTKDLPLTEKEIETPICKTIGQVLKSDDICVVPVLRAGLGMLDGITEVIPNAKIGFIGCKRNEENHLPIDYYCKLPVITEEQTVILLDPMLATGGSANLALDILKKNGAKNIKFLCLVAAPQGVEAVNKKHPNVRIYAANLDECLNEQAYIVPGLGDVGDRLNGTNL